MAHGLNGCIRGNPDSFSHLNRKKIYRTLEEYLTLAEELAKKNNGILPNSKWLKQNGYHGLYAYAIKNKGCFSHIKKTENRPRQTLMMHLKVAEKLAEENNEILPNYKWLRDNGYHGLNSCVSKNHDSFSHLRRKKTDTLQEYVELAKKISEGHEGILPGQKWLKQNDMRKLAECIYSQAESFKGIKQKWHSGVRKIGE